MIPNTTAQNMGGITALSVALVSDIADMLSLAGSSRITYASGKSALSAYFSHNSAQIITSKAAGNMYNIQVKFRSPNDRAALLAAILSYVNQKVVIIATDSNGEVKVYGSTKCPLILTHEPTPKGNTSDYNGVAFEASGLDFAPGRFLVTT